MQLIVQPYWEVRVVLRKRAQWNRMWRELACGELERPHASGWEEDDPPHRQETWNHLNRERNI